MTQPNPLWGDFLALLTAVTWGAAVITYKLSGQVLGALSFKLFQNISTTVLLGVSLFAFGSPLILSLDGPEHGLLFVSAILGITLGDTFYVAALTRIGAGYVALVDFIYSPTIILLAFFWYSETMTHFEVLGGALILSSVVTGAVSELRQESRASAKDVKWGLLYAVMSQLCMALCVVLIRDLLRKDSILTITAYRYFFGTLVLIIFVLGMGKSREIMKGFRPHPRQGLTLLSTLIGPYLSTLLWFAGFKYTSAGRAAILNQSSSLFIVLFATIFLREPMNRVKAISFLVALFGGFLMSL